MNLSLDDLAAAGARPPRRPRPAAAEPPAGPPPEEELDRRQVADPDPEGLAMPANADPLSVLADMEEPELFKVYQVHGALSRPRLAWLATVDQAPTEEELLALAGPGRYAVRAIAPGGLVVSEVLVVLSNRIGQAGGAPAATPDLLRALVPHIPALIQAIRQPAAAAAGVPAPALGIGELMKLYQLQRMMADDAAPVEAAEPAAPGMVEALAGGLAGQPGAPWWAPLVAQLATAINGPGSTPADLSPATVAAFLSQPGALVQVVQQLQGSAEGLELLAQVKQALA